MTNYVFKDGGKYWIENHRLYDEDGEFVPMFEGTKEECEKWITQQMIDLEKSKEEKNVKEQEMESYQLRVIEEEKELSGKHKKLCSFIEGESFKSLDAVDQFLLRRQCEIMNDYIDVLKSRIERFNV